MNAVAETHEHEPGELQTIPQAILFLMRRQGGKGNSAPPWEVEPGPAVYPETAPDAAQESEAIVANLLRAIESTEIAARLGPVPPSANAQPAVSVIAPPAESAESADALFQVVESGPAARPQPATDAAPKSDPSVTILLRAVRNTDLAASIDPVPHPDDANPATIASVPEAETEETALALPQAPELDAPAHLEFAPDGKRDSDEAPVVLECAVANSETVASLDVDPPAGDKETSLLASVEPAEAAEATATLELPIASPTGASPAKQTRRVQKRGTHRRQPSRQRTAYLLSIAAPAVVPPPAAVEAQPAPAAAPCEPELAAEPLTSFLTAELPQPVESAVELQPAPAAAPCDPEHAAEPLTAFLTAELPQLVESTVELQPTPAATPCEPEHAAEPLTAFLTAELPQLVESAVELQPAPAAAPSEPEHVAEPLTAFLTSELPQPVESAVEAQPTPAASPSQLAELTQSLPLAAVPTIAEPPQPSAKDPAAEAKPLLPPNSAGNSALRAPTFAQFDTEKGSLATTAGLINEGLDRAEIQLERWFQKWFGPPDPRYTRRVTEPPLVAYHWIVDTPQALRIANISAGGLYLLTNERWSPGNIVSMTLQRTDRPKGSPESWIAVDFLVMRWCEDGMAGAFIASVPGLKNAVSGRAQNCADKRALERFVEKLASPSHEAAPAMTAPGSASPSHSPA